MALSQVQALARENAALRQERDSLARQLAVARWFPYRRCVRAIRERTLARPRVGL